jgi:hypothetical protein
MYCLQKIKKNKIKQTQIKYFSSWWRNQNDMNPYRCIFKKWYSQKCIQCLQWYSQKCIQCLQWYSQKCIQCLQWYSQKCTQCLQQSSIFNSQKCIQCLQWYSQKCAQCLQWYSQKCTQCLQQSSIFNIKYFRLYMVINFYVGVLYSY